MVNSLIGIPPMEGPIMVADEVEVDEQDLFH